MPTPRVFILRHGETTWSLSGQHTSTTELPLTPAGDSRIRATAAALVGPNRLIVPSNLAHVYVSPRRRAQRTLELLSLGCGGGGGLQGVDGEVQVETTERVAEWAYGAYEGLTSAQIRAQRASQGLNADWDIWRDGCPGGDTPASVTARVDAFISELRARFHEGRFGGDVDAGPNDVLVVAHGHILRALAARWVGRELRDNPSLILEAGGVGTLSYEHNNIEEPAILLGGAFVVGDAGTEGEEGRV